MLINALRLRTYTCIRKSLLIQIKVCHLFGSKPLFESILLSAKWWPFCLGLKVLILDLMIPGSQWIWCCISKFSRGSSRNKTSDFTQNFTWPVFYWVIFKGLIMERCALLTSTPECVVSPHRAITRGQPEWLARGETTHIFTNKFSLTIKSIIFLSKFYWHSPIFTSQGLQTSMSFPGLQDLCGQINVLAVLCLRAVPMSHCIHHGNVPDREIQGYPRIPTTNPYVQCRLFHSLLYSANSIK